MRKFFAEYLSSGMVLYQTDALYLVTYVEEDERDREDNGNGWWVCKRNEQKHEHFRKLLSYLYLWTRVEGIQVSLPDLLGVWQILAAAIGYFEIPTTIILFHKS